MQVQMKTIYNTVLVVVTSAGSLADQLTINQEALGKLSHLEWCSPQISAFAPFTGDQILGVVFLQWVFLHCYYATHWWLHSLLVFSVTNLMVWVTETDGGQSWAEFLIHSLWSSPEKQAVLYRDYKEAVCLLTVSLRYITHYFSAQYVTCDCIFLYRRICGFSITNAIYVPMLDIWHVTPAA